MTVTDLIRDFSNVGELRFNVGVAPSLNHMYYNTKGGGKRLTSKAERYVRDSRALINLAIDEQNWAIVPKGVWLYVDMVFYFPDRRIRDAHNCLKLLLDVMQGTVYENDYTILPRIMSVEYDKDNPRIEIHVHAQTKQLREQHINDMMVLS